MPGAGSNSLSGSVRGGVAGVGLGCLEGSAGGLGTGVLVGVGAGEVSGAGAMMLLLLRTFPMQRNCLSGKSKGLDAGTRKNHFHTQSINYLPQRLN